MAYSTDFRQKALEAVRNGRTKKEVNKLLGLADSTLKDWEELEKETGSLEKRPLNRKPTKIDDDALHKYCKDYPFATHIEAAIHFKCSEAGIRKAKKRLGITRKKDNLLHRAL